MQHRTAMELRAAMGERVWRRRFSFALVRNPSDKVASQYHHRVSTNQTGLGERPMPFPGWVRATFRDRDGRYYDWPLMPWT